VLFVAGVLFVASERRDAHHPLGRAASPKRRNAELRSCAEFGACGVPCSEKA
jgi:hypothetical protein